MKKLLEIPVAAGFCKNCFGERREGSAYCGVCNGNVSERFAIYIDDEQENFPLYKKVKEIFPINDRTIFTYGDTIYARNLDYGLVRHEITHVFQQIEMGIEKWWEKYFAEPEFRLMQESEAYSKQHKVYVRKDPEKAEIMLTSMAKDLSGGLYGDIITPEDAKDLIKNYDDYEKREEQIENEVNDLLVEELDKADKNEVMDR